MRLRLTEASLQSNLRYVSTQSLKSIYGLITHEMMLTSLLWAAVGTPISTSQPNLPALRKAGSILSLLFVIPITTTA